MNPAHLATEISASLPAWVLEELSAGPQVLPTAEDRMRLANRLASLNHYEGSGRGPFAALVVDSDTGELISVGVNVVLASGLSSQHAEVTALGLAQARLRTWDLGAEGQPATELVVNWRPCVMCYGATMWSGVRRLVVAGEGPELEQLTGFDEGPMVEDWKEQFTDRGIEVITGVLREEAIAVFAEYGAREDKIVYNGRQGRPAAPNAS